MKTYLKTDKLKTPPIISKDHVQLVSSIVLGIVQLYSNGCPANGLCFSNGFCYSAIGAYIFLPQGGPVII